MRANCANAASSCVCKANQLLAILLQDAGNLVTRKELRSQLWPADTFVDFDHSLHNAIGRIRETLGDSAETPRYIETLPRRGYRFIAPVEQVQALRTSEANGNKTREAVAVAPQSKTRAATLALTLLVLAASGSAFWLVRAVSPPTSAAPAYVPSRYYHSRTYLAIPHRNISRMA